MGNRLSRSHPAPALFEIGPQQGNALDNFPLDDWLIYGFESSEGQGSAPSRKLFGGLLRQLDRYNLPIPKRPRHAQPQCPLN
jgi:hypothetical protein